MIYLLFAIICSSLIAIIFKISEDRYSNRFAINTFNYINASVISLIMIGHFNIFNISWFDSFFNEINDVFIQGNMFSSAGSQAWGVIIGALTGIIYYLSFYLYQHNVKSNGPALSATFMKLGILIPTTLSMILFRELPNLFQGIGILFAVIGILIINLSLEKEVIKRFRFDLVFLFIMGGLGDFNAKLYQQYALAKHEQLFVFYIFFTALIISIIMLLLRNRKISKFDITIGLLVGIPNQLTSVFLLKSLATIKASVAFPIFSVGTILFVNLVSLFIFKKKLNQRQYIAMMIIILALILLNIRT